MWTSPSWAGATMEQLLVAAELSQQANDVQQLAPMLTAIRTTLTSAGVTDPLQRLAADSGYWSIAKCLHDPAGA